MASVHLNARMYLQEVGRQRSLPIKQFFWHNPRIHTLIMTFDSKCAYCIDQLLGQHVKNSGFRIYSEFGGAENTDSPAD